MHQCKGTRANPGAHASAQSGIGGTTGRVACYPLWDLRGPSAPGACNTEAFWTPPVAEDSGAALSLVLHPPLLPTATPPAGPPDQAPSASSSRSPSSSPSFQDLQKDFQVFIGQHRLLFGLRSNYLDATEMGISRFLNSERGFTEWELDLLYGHHTCFNLLSCATTLEPLSKLVQSLPRMIIMDEIGKQPFFAPVSLHVLPAAIKELKRYKREQAKYLTFAADQARAASYSATYATLLNVVYT